MTRPLLLTIATAMVSFGPLAAHLARQWSGRNWADPVVWALLGWGLLYFPMGLLAVALHPAALALPVVLPPMHLAWGLGFLVGRAR